VVAGLPLLIILNTKVVLGLFKHKIPGFFLISLIGLTIWSFRENLSIPLLGLVSCLYMMAELSVWIYFSAWLLIGLTIYFGFSRKIVG
jgi:hypothetical protein